jgi:hypothetical protein
MLWSQELTFAFPLSTNHLVSGDTARVAAWTWHLTEAQLHTATSGIRAVSSGRGPCCLQGAGAQRASGWMCIGRHVQLGAIRAPFQSGRDFINLVIRARAFCKKVEVDTSVTCV